jgi:hypothetical protein
MKLILLSKIFILIFQIKWSEHDYVYSLNGYISLYIVILTYYLFGCNAVIVLNFIF